MRRPWLFAFVWLAFLHGLAGAAAEEGPFRQAEYRPLPVGTRLVYDNFECTVTRAEDFRTTCQVGGSAGPTINVFGHFINYGDLIDSGYLKALGSLTGAGRAAQIGSLGLGNDAAENLARLWPLKIGNSTTYDFVIGWKEKRLGDGFGSATVTVSREDAIEVGGHSILAVVVEERAEIGLLTDLNRSWQNKAGRATRAVFERTWWYDPELGVIVKANVRWTKEPHAGISSEIILRRVEFPPGEPEPLAARPARSADQSLPPAEYKPLPVDARLIYDDFECKVIESKGFETACQLRDSRAGPVQIFGHLVPFGAVTDQGYLKMLRIVRGSLGETQIDELNLDESAKSNLKRLWPLTIGNTAEYRFSLRVKAGFSGDGFGSGMVHVSREDDVTIAGVSHRTVVVEEVAEVTLPMKAQAYGGRRELRKFTFERISWYDPEMGVVVKARMRWSGGANSGMSSESALRRIEYP